MLFMSRGNISNLTKHIENVRKGHELGSNLQLVPQMRDIIAELSSFERQAGTLGKEPAVATVVRIKLFPTWLADFDILKASQRSYWHFRCPRPSLSIARDIYPSYDMLGSRTETRGTS